MKAKILSEISRDYRNEARLLKQKELLGFVRQQFRQLMEKNLRIPIKLYHL